MGIDVGSTTAKLVVLDESDGIVFSDYRRHHTQIDGTITDILSRAESCLGDQPASVIMTGSAGMGLAEKASIPFVQEVVAAAEAARRFFTGVRTFIDIGGEDSKIIFFDKNMRPDIRMNGSCAGGTGAFIDQMAALINVPVGELSKLAVKYKNIYPIASRCGVFAKTDIQNLLSRNIAKADMAASIFHAVVIQSLNTLSRGFEIVPKVLLAGGPLAFMPALRKAFIHTIGIKDVEAIIPERPELIPAIGAAIENVKSRLVLTLRDLTKRLGQGNRIQTGLKERIQPLFQDHQDFHIWNQQRLIPIERGTLPENDSIDAYIGIDSGSTTSKMVLIDRHGRILLDYYVVNNGDHLDAVGRGLSFFEQSLRQNNTTVNIKRTVVTGYGEDLVKAAFNIDQGVVETIAHLKAARHFDNAVSFILDIGGQDMKAIFIENGFINRIEINEACSSGCGSFIQTFAQTLGHTVESFAEMACAAEEPCDLGSRCTVFMNSRVKQFLREGASVPDLAAGLAYSVIKNSLTKVLKVNDMSVLGDHIMVQGGTFENPAVHRAFELLTGKKISCPNIMKLMGAYGAALIAKEACEENNFQRSDFIGFAHLDRVKNHTRKLITCKGCENQCVVTKIRFDTEKVFFTGNKCEKIFTNKGENQTKGYNLAVDRVRLLFEREMAPETPPLLTVGIPRALNMWENFPFWCTLFREAGIRVKLSERSHASLYEKGLGTIMSDNICFPAKLTHGHIADLLDQDVDRIFYPLVVYESQEEACVNSYNCPIVTGYPDVMDSALDPLGKSQIPLDRPTINFNDTKLLKKSCFQYFTQLGVKQRVFRNAFEKALAAQTDFRHKMIEKSERIVAAAAVDQRKVINLVGRPYHCDSLINHKIPEIISDYGIDLILGDIPLQKSGLDDIQVLTQWAYTNRLYQNAKYCCEHPHVEMVELNSFGCGPDTIAIDEIVEVLKAADKQLTLIRIDEVSSPGSIRLRLRTMIEAMKMRDQAAGRRTRKRANLPIYTEADRRRKLLVPYFAEIYSDFFVTAFKSHGVAAEMLPPSDNLSLDLGLKYTNNEVCFPGILVVGDIIKALTSGKYDPDQIVVGISQTGGPCRASNYLGLIKKAMLAAGFGSVPIVSVSTQGKELNDQPGFEIDHSALYKTSLLAILYGDALSMMQHTMMVRAKNPEKVTALVRKYIGLVQWGIAADDVDYIIDLLEKAVMEFNRLPVKSGEFPCIGIVGEIFVKYSQYANHNVANWLTRNGIEVVVPPLSDFFIQELINTRANAEAFISRKNSSWFLTYYIENRLNRVLKRINSVLEGYRFNRPFHSIRHLAEKAQNAINLVNQSGEGWLITAEMMMFAEDHVNDILCLQPFGCISNQVIAKGVEKRLKDLYPGLNILFFDLDQDTSEANFINRLHFLVRSARQAVASRAGC
jgi:predicted CoA-substrate-specific enzyme activase